MLEDVFSNLSSSTVDTLCSAASVSSAGSGATSTRRARRRRRVGEVSDFTLASTSLAKSRYVSGAFVDSGSPKTSSTAEVIALI